MEAILNFLNYHNLNNLKKVSVFLETAVDKYLHANGGEKAKKQFTLDWQQSVKYRTEVKGQQMENNCNSIKNGDKLKPRIDKSL